MCPEEVGGGIYQHGTPITNLCIFRTAEWDRRPCQETTPTNRLRCYGRTLHLV